MGVIIFNGLSSKDYGIEVEHPPKYEIPERDYEVTHIPGRNGDIIIDKGSYKNVARKYDIAVGSMEDDKFTELVNRIPEWLHSVSGYAYLEDSYEPDYYRLAMCINSIEVENILHQAGRTTIEFTCKPQRFLKTGNNIIRFASSGTLRNPTNFDALPLIKIYGSGSGVLRIGNYTITISNIDSYITIDSEIQDAYKLTLNKNSSIVLSNGFPVLTKGNNSISFTGGITSLEVTPKWWTL